GLLQGLAVFHEAGRHGPEATAWLDGTAAQQDAALVVGHAADHEARILVMDRAAGLAHVARQVIARRHAQLHPRRAFTAVFHHVPARIRANAAPCRRARRPPARPYSRPKTATPLVCCTNTLPPATVGVTNLMGSPS